MQHAKIHRFVAGSEFEPAQLPNSRAHIAGIVSDDVVPSPAGLTGTGSDLGTDIKRRSGSPSSCISAASPIGSGPDKFHEILLRWIEDLLVVEFVRQILIASEAYACILPAEMAIKNLIILANTVF